MSTSSTTSSSSAGTASFTGQSSFATDLQSVITRSIGIAQLPITQLQNSQSTLTSQQGELQTLGNNFESLQTALDTLSSSTGFNSFAATVDTPSVASASLTAGALAGTYSVKVSSVGSQTSAISAAGSTPVTDPSTASISSSSAFTLSVNGTSFAIAPSGNTLNDLVQAINASGAKVQATVVNVGGSAAADYRLSIQSSEYAPDTVQLNDGTNNLLSTLTPGSYVTYQVNGQPTTAVSSTSRSLSISTGLSVNVLQTGTANVTVAQGSTSISTALSALATSYNAALDELTKNRGQNGGALTGQSTVADLTSALEQVSGYNAASTGTVNSISDLGLTFDTTGHLQFDQSVFDATASTSLSDVTTFLGSETGGGFLQSAYNTITSLTDPTTGVISEASQSLGASVNSLTAQISAKQAQVAQLQTTLTAQMAAADSAISSLESQVTEITNLFAAQTQAAKSITG